MMIFASGLFYFFISHDQKLVQIEGAIMFILLILFIIYIVKFQKYTDLDDNIENEPSLTNSKILIYLFLGGFSLWLGSETLIKGAITLAKNLGVSERIISVSIVSIGTSIPELSASIIAIINKEKAISLGNLVGSNIFNIMAVLGITSIIHPLSVEDPGLLSNDIWWMLGISILILPLSLYPTNKKIGRVQGLALFLLYVIFVTPLFFL